jgi:uncharacterized protein YwgA
MDLEKTIACIKACGIKPKVSSFNDKLVVQKTMFLLKQKGLDCGAKFGLYIRGPYSPELTRAIYSEKEKFEKLDTNTTINKKEEEILKEFKEIFEEPIPGILEVAATYAYFAYEKKEPALEALKMVRELKGSYPEAEIALGISKAKQFLYQPTKKELEEMKKEFQDWESA